MPPIRVKEVGTATDILLNTDDISTAVPEADFTNVTLRSGGVVSIYQTIDQIEDAIFRISRGRPIRTAPIRGG
jgi:hypothetical protein